LKKKEKIVIYGGSFNPSHRAHIWNVETLAKIFDRVIVVLRGCQSEKSTLKNIDPKARGEMTRIAFEDISRVKLDFYDIEKSVYTPTYFLQQRFERIYPQAEIWHAVGSDLVKGGEQGKWDLQTWIRGRNIWRTLHWIVIQRPGQKAKKSDMPPHSSLIDVKGFLCSGTMIREKVAQGKSISNLVTPEIEEYIRRNDLYKS
jgi:nicotinate-nucleotide adenylyltransferase